MARRKMNPEHPTRMNRIGHRPPSNIVRQKREVKERGKILTWESRLGYAKFYRRKIEGFDFSRSNGSLSKNPDIKTPLVAKNE